MQNRPVGIDRVVVAGEQGRAERPIAGVLIGIWRGRWIVIACVAIASIYGYIRVRTAVPVYTATSTVCVQPSLPNLLPDMMANTGQSVGYVSTQVEIIHSTALLTLALGQPGVTDTDCLRGVESPVAYLKNAVIVGPNKSGADLIDVQMDSINPRDAATIVNGVVAAYIAYQSQAHMANATDMMKVLQKDLSRQEAELKTEQQQITDFKKANPVVVMQIEEGKTFNSPLESQLTTARLQTTNLKIANDLAQRFPTDPNFLKQTADNVAAMTSIPLENRPVIDPATDADYHRTCLELLTREGEKNGSEYQNLERQRNELEADLRRQRDDSIKRYTLFLSQQLEAASLREEQLRKEVDDQRSAFNEVFAKGADYSQLLQQTENTQQSLSTLRSQMKAVNVSGDIGALTAYILEPAKPNQTNGTGKTKIMGMAIVMGLMAGIGGSLLREMVEQRFRSVEEVSRLLRTPILGSVSHILNRTGRVLPEAGKPSGTPWLAYLRVAGAKNRRHWNTHQTLMQRGQAMHLQPRSDIAEAYRAIRTSIYFGLAGQPAKTILITSPVSGDGKTTLASNLAIAIAQAGRRVLLIDADCWHPTQHNIFGLGEGIGFTSILRRKAALAEVVRKTDIENLEILPCGEIPNNPAELLDSPALLELLNEASEKYDQVLIDSPPVVPITDARILAANCGATILVLRAGKSTRRMADDAFEALGAVGAPILGLVVNDVSRQSRSRSHNYYNHSVVQPGEDWNRYTPTEQTNGHAEPKSQPGNGHMMQLPGTFIDHDEVTGHEVD